MMLHLSLSALYSPLTHVGLWSGDNPVLLSQLIRFKPVAIRCSVHTTVAERWDNNTGYAISEELPAFLSQVDTARQQ